MRLPRSLLPFTLALAVALPALAQERGRTDGVEGSEIGAGGYQRVGYANYSIELSGGAALSDRQRGDPLFAGLNLGYWLDDWLQLEAEALYLWRTGATDLLIGPRFRSNFYPIGFSLGLKAGAIILPDDIGLRFGISPNARLDLMVSRGALAGLGYAVDIPVGETGDGPSNLAHRLFLSLGWRF